MPAANCFSNGRRWSAMHALLNWISQCITQRRCKGAFSSSFENVIVWLAAQIISVRCIVCHHYPVSNPPLLRRILMKLAKGELVYHWTEDNWSCVNWCNVDSKHCTSVTLDRLQDLTQMTIEVCCSPREGERDPFTSSIDAVYRIFFSIMLRTSLLSSLLDVKHSWKST